MQPKSEPKFNLPFREYYRLEQGAQILGCAVDDLIHWAAHSEITLYANLYGKLNFLRKQRCFEDGPEEPLSEEITPDGIFMVLPEDMRTFELEGYCNATEFYQVDKHGHYWHVETDPAVTLHGKHLFLPVWEIENLQRDTPSKSVTSSLELQRSPDRAPHPNTERFAANRERVLMAAMYCKAEWPTQCGTTYREWAKLIDEKAALFWPDTANPPLSLDTIERLLGDAHKLPADAE